jgi:hypothetical protein
MTLFFNVHGADIYGHGFLCHELFAFEGSQMTGDDFNIVLKLESGDFPAKLRWFGLEGQQLKLSRTRSTGEKEEAIFGKLALEECEEAHQVLEPKMKAMMASGRRQSWSSPRKPAAQAMENGLFLSWSFADTYDPLSYYNPVRWSSKMSWPDIIEDILAHNRGFVRPIHVTEYAGETQTRTYKASSYDELKEQSAVASSHMVPTAEQRAKAQSKMPEEKLWSLRRPRRRPSADKPGCKDAEDRISDKGLATPEATGGSCVSGTADAAHEPALNDSINGMLRRLQDPSDDRNDFNNSSLAQITTGLLHKINKAHHTSSTRAAMEKKMSTSCRALLLVVQSSLCTLLLERECGGVATKQAEQSSALNVSEQETAWDDDLLTTDPWEGCHDIATEDLFEWFACSLHCPSECMSSKSRVSTDCALPCLELPTSARGRSAKPISTLTADDPEPKPLEPLCCQRRSGAGSTEQSSAIVLEKGLPQYPCSIESLSTASGGTQRSLASTERLSIDMPRHMEADDTQCAQQSLVSRLFTITYGS